MHQTNDLIKFNQLFIEHRKSFVYYTQTYVGNIHVAEDIVNESFIVYWDHFNEVEIEKARTYILTIIKNKSLNYLRQQVIHRQKLQQIHGDATWELELKISAMESYEPSDILTDEIQTIVRKAIKKLPKKTQLIFKMSRENNSSYKEIAEKVGLSVKSVEFHISKTLKILRECLKDYFVIILTFINYIQGGFF